MYPNLKLQMWRCGMRQNRLAKILGMHETVLSRMVNGFRMPSQSTRLQIAALLHSDAEWLFAAEDQTNGNPAVEPLAESRAHGPAPGQQP